MTSGGARGREGRRGGIRWTRLVVVMHTCVNSVDIKIWDGCVWGPGARGGALSFAAKCVGEICFRAFGMLKNVWMV